MSIPQYKYRNFLFAMSIISKFFDFFDYFSRKLRKKRSKFVVCTNKIIKQNTNLYIMNKDILDRSLLY